MKTFLVIIFLLLASGSRMANAQGAKPEIKHYETRDIAGSADGKILVDNKVLKIGDTFSSKSTIKWQSPNQGIKAYDGEDVVIFVPNGKQYGVNQVLPQPYKTTTGMTIRGYPTTTEDHIEAFQGVDVMHGSLAIAVGWLCNDKAGFTATFTTTEGEKVTKPIAHFDEYLLFDNEFFGLPENLDSAVDLEITIEYTNINGRSITFPTWRLAVDVLHD